MSAVVSSAIPSSTLSHEDEANVLTDAPRLYGKLPKAGAQPSYLSFHIVYEDVMTRMHDGVELAGDLFLPAVNNRVDLRIRSPCVLVRTPYNKSVVNPDFRNPGIYWTQNGYACFIQDCRGRFKSGGNFYKYCGEAEDGYDTVEWLAVQSWCNGCIVTDGPSYLCHVQTSMAILRPPHLKAMFCNKGGFFNAHTSGVRNGGAYEARQWVWALKNANRVKVGYTKDALESVEKNFAEWLRRYPFKHGCSPLSDVPEYEEYIFDQVNNSDYNDYWKKIGLNTEEYLDEFMDVPALFFSGWYDIYCRSTIDFFTHLANRKKGPIQLIMGPWQHVGQEGHVAGEVDFGVNALVSGNLAPNIFSLTRRWFDRFVEPASAQPNLSSLSSHAQLKQLTPQEKLQQAIAAAEKQQSSASHCSLRVPHARGPYTSLSRIAHSLSNTHLNEAKNGPSLYVLPSALPRERVEPVLPLPPTVRYFRMGGGDGHRTSQGCCFHGGVWMQSQHWPPLGTKYINYYLQRRILTPQLYDQKGGMIPNGNQQMLNGEPGEQDDTIASPAPLNEASTADSSSQLVTVSKSLRNKHYKPQRPPSGHFGNLDNSTSYLYDPSNPCPSIGGNLFSYKNILLSGAYNQVERSDMFLCKHPGLPLFSRKDVCVFRSQVLEKALDITGMPVVCLYISSSCVDTDFTAKLIDEYPPSLDYPNGFAMQITHGIRRCRYRDSRERATLMQPGTVYEIQIELYPTSNLFNKSHRLRLDISSSNYPHFDLNMNTGEDFESQRVQVAENTIYHSMYFPSRLILPVQTTAVTDHIAVMEEVNHN